jgi:putative flippase GtrA
MKKYYEKYRELFDYLIVGVLTTVISLAVYYACIWTFANPDNPVLLQVANVLSWIVSVLFAYVMSRRFVFRSQNEHIVQEIIKFFLSRLATLFMDMGIMFVLVTLLKQNANTAKLVSQVVVIVMNYVLSKLLVFRKK